MCVYVSLGLCCDMEYATSKSKNTSVSALCVRLLDAHANILPSLYIYRECIQLVCQMYRVEKYPSELKLNEDYVNTTFIDPK